MENIKEIIEKHRKAIAYKLDINIDEVSQAMQLLKSCLKLKYSKGFYYNDKDVKTFIDLDNDFNIIKLRATYNHFFGNDYVEVFGVTLKIKNGVIESKTYNMVKDIPNLLENQADKNLFSLREQINMINKNIEIELRKILSRDNNYLEYIQIEETALTSKLNFEKNFNRNLEDSDIIKKCGKKLKQLYKYNPINIITLGSSIQFHKIEIGIYAKVEPFVYDRCLTLEFTRDTIYLGNLTIEYNDKIKFEPNFKNEKYFTKEISSLKYMRNTFKKYLANCIEF